MSESLKENIANAKTGEELDRLVAKQIDLQDLFELSNLLWKVSKFVELTPLQTNLLNATYKQISNIYSVIEKEAE